MKWALLWIGLALGCASERDARVQVERLAVPAERAAAAASLRDLYAAASHQDGGQDDGPRARAFRDQAIGALDAACRDPATESAARHELVSLVAAMRDPRGSACLFEWLQRVRQKPPASRFSGRTLGLVAPVVQSIAAQRLDAGAGPLWQTFLATVPSLWPHQDVASAVLDLHHPSWEEPATLLLSSPMPVDASPEQASAHLFRKVVAARLLGVMRSAAATRPLLRSLSSPTSTELAPTALQALLKIGRPAIPAAIALLEERDAELIQRHDAEWVARLSGPAADLRTTPRGLAATVLGTLGHPSASEPMLRALQTSDPATRARIAAALAELPRTPATAQALLATLLSTDETLLMPPGIFAKTALAQAVARFYDPSLVPALVAAALPADGAPVGADWRRAALVSAMKLMTRGQVDAVRRLLDARVAGEADLTLGAGMGQAFSRAAGLLDDCGAGAGCYLERLRDEAPRSQPDLSTFKAATMVAVYGSARDLPALVDLIKSARDPELRLSLVTVLDYLAPDGAPEPVLQELFAIATASLGDVYRERFSLAPVATLVERLRLRALP